MKRLIKTEEKYFEKINKGIYIKMVKCRKYKTTKYVANLFYKNVSNI